MTHQCPNCGALCGCWQADDPLASESDGNCHHDCELEENSEEEDIDDGELDPFSTWYETD